MASLQLRTYFPSGYDDLILCDLLNRNYLHTEYVCYVRMFLTQLIFPFQSAAAVVSEAWLSDSQSYQSQSAR